MEIFELITITLSFIVGLGVAQVLASVVGVIRARKDRELHWLPLAWAASIFLAHVQFWFALYSRNEQVTWTWGTFGPVLLLAVFLFLSGGLILPSEASQRSETLLEDFREHGRLSLIPPFSDWLGARPGGRAELQPTDGGAPPPTVTLTRLSRLLAGPFLMPSLGHGHGAL